MEKEHILLWEEKIFFQNLLSYFQVIDQNPVTRSIKEFVKVST